MNPDLTASALVPLLPELLLGVGAMTLLILGAYRSEEAGRLIDAASVALLVIAGLIVLVLPEGRLVAFNGSFVVDDFARFLKILAMFGSAAAIVMSLDYARREREERFEYSVLILLSTLGMLMLISAADLIALYLGLELMSLPLYVVAASHRVFAALDRSRAEVFRPRRALVGNAALRRLAGLRLHRHGELYRHRAIGRRRRRLD